jgi:hypothetical protein
MGLRFVNDKYKNTGPIYVNDKYKVNGANICERYIQKTLVNNQCDNDNSHMIIHICI